MKAEVPREGSLYEMVPGRLVVGHGVSAIGEDDAMWLTDRQEHFEEFSCQGDFTGLALGGFRPGHREQPAVKVDILPELMQHLAAPEPRIERRDDHPPKMKWSSFEEQFLFGYTQDRTLHPALSK